MRISKVFFDFRGDIYIVPLLAVRIHSTDPSCEPVKQLGRSGLSLSVNLQSRSSMISPRHWRRFASLRFLSPRAYLFQLDSADIHRRIELNSLCWRRWVLGLEAACRLGSFLCGDFTIGNLVVDSPIGDSLHRLYFVEIVLVRFWLFNEFPVSQVNSICDQVLYIIGLSILANL